MRSVIVILTMMLVVSLAAREALSNPRESVAGPVNGAVLKVVDGDTLKVRLKVWLGQSIETHVRLAGIDTPEIKGQCPAERRKAYAARDEVRRLLRHDTTRDVILQNIQPDKYGSRVVAEVKLLDGTSVADHLIRQGLARPYHGGKRAGWCA